MMNDKTCFRLIYSNGFSFVEIVIAILVAAGCAIPIFYMITSARTETSKSINYLRALELANEAIEWASVSDFNSDLNSQVFGGVGGGLVEEIGNDLTPVSVMTAAAVNPVWNADGVIAQDLRYSEQYNQAFFWRSITVEEVDSNFNRFASGLLKKITVEVSWNEGKTPPNINDGSDRMRKIRLSTIILNERAKGL